MEEVNQEVPMIDFDTYQEGTAVWIQNPFPLDDSPESTEARFSVPPFDTEPSYRNAWKHESISARPVWVPAVVASSNQYEQELIVKIDLPGIEK